MRWLYHRLMFAVLALTVMALGSVPVYVAWWWKDVHPGVPSLGYYSASLAVYFDTNPNAFPERGFVMGAQTESSWRLNPWGSIQYSTVTLKRAEKGRGVRHRLAISLPDLSFEEDGRTNLLTEGELRRWLQLGETNDFVTSDETLGFILEKIQRAGTGKFPVSPFDGYEYKQPDVTSYVIHRQEGIGAPTWVIAWWLLSLPLFFLLFRRPQRWEKKLP